MLAGPDDDAGAIGPGAGVSLDGKPIDGDIAGSDVKS